MTKDEALRLALETLYENTQYSEQGHPLTYQSDRNDDVIIEINKTLAQPECEWVGLEGVDMDEITHHAVSIVDAMLLTEEKLKELNT